MSLLYYYVSIRRKMHIDRASVSLLFYTRRLQNKLVGTISPYTFAFTHRPMHT